MFSYISVPAGTCNVQYRLMCWKYYYNITISHLYYLSESVRVVFYYNLEVEKQKLASILTSLCVTGWLVIVHWAGIVFLLYLVQRLCPNFHIWSKLCSAFIIKFKSLKIHKWKLKRSERRGKSKRILSGETMIGWMQWKDGWINEWMDRWSTTTCLLLKTHCILKWIHSSNFTLFQTSSS